MTRWSLQAVEKAAPDASSLKAGRGLARPGPWSDTGSTDTLVWGKCQGSGSTPYQVSVDLSGPAYRCSCPSRKFPCKHALALLLLWAGGALEEGAADAGTAAAAREWAEQRAAKAAGAAVVAATRPQGSTAPVDSAARARRLEERLALMTAGLDDLALWLEDLVRGGLVQARRQPWAWWDAAAARLVDAQLPGLAQQLRDMGSDVHHRSDWSDHLLAGIGRWWTAIATWRRADLDEGRHDDLRADLRVHLGWSWSGEEIRAGEQTTGRWAVLGAHRTDDGRLQEQRTWLRSVTTGEVVQVLDFAARAQPLPAARIMGTELEVTLARYPGTSPRRALFVGEPVVTGNPGSVHALPEGSTLDGALADLAEVWAANPWAVRVPAVLHAAVLVPASEDRPAMVADTDGRAVPLLDASPWTLLALGGGRPGRVFGELEEDGFRVLRLDVEDPREEL